MDRKTGKEVMSEDRQQRKTTGKRGKGMWLLAMATCLVILVAVMYGGLTLYTMLQERAQEVSSNNVNGLDLDEDGNVVDENGNVVSAVSNSVVYTQEELDAKVAEAILEAQDQGMEEVLDAIVESMSEGRTPLDTVKSLFPDHIIVASDGRYHFVPINYDLAQNQLLTENLNILDSGEIQYMQEGQVISHKGIDVSKFQGAIDWSKVAGDGVEYAFIRVGYRGWGSSGRLVEDEYFEANMQGALKAGIKVGVYFYSQAITEEEAVEEANFVLERIEPYNVECPVVFDVEKVSEDSARMNQITLEERTYLTKVFCQTVKDAGYKPMIYHNTQMGALMLDLTELEEFDKWFAAYTNTLYYPYEYKVWQYSDKGRVAGIKGNVDLNICFAPLWE
ncbi:MAG: glycoside hydrolase family 25 protein [Acetatifactor sp.]|nr:glycoside hydrolase family 25 protein [Acetatifactor sp.]